LEALKVCRGPHKDHGLRKEGCRGRPKPLGLTARPRKTLKLGHRGDKGGGSP